MEINQNITTRNYTKASNRKIEYIVIHYVGAVSSAKNNTIYFKSTYRGASAHYFVDDNSIWQCVLDKDIAWHCGGGIQGKGGHEYYKKCLNSNSIGIEMCCYKNDGKLDISNATINNTIELTKELMQKHNISADKVIMHYNVIGKNCPAPFVSNMNRWNDFKNELFSGNKPEPVIKYSKGNYKTLYVMKVRTGAGTEFRQKRRNELTANGRKNATITGCYKQGTVFTALEIIDRGNNEYWARTPSGYICIRDRKQEYCKKI